MSNEPIFLFRKGGKLRDTVREKRIKLSPPNSSIYLPAIFTQQTFVVPRGKFLVPIDVDGMPLRARIQDTDETVSVFPEFRLIGVEDGDGGQRLATALYHDYNN